MLKSKEIEELELYKEALSNYPEAPERFCADLLMSGEIAEAETLQRCIDSLVIAKLTDEDVEEVEDLVGMGCGAWDTVDPKEIMYHAYSYLKKKEAIAIKDRYERRID
ncbi:hypothetical protein Xen7305DRAFT_00008980 [Xenococcus sp. PCC 7305]|uniref:hypothetical protein n=1 Tax=Xenococcus sp. PCC 7305 TaxID=102125 RepID=UPI0002ABE603|nr:hypothetical protein [Xenococcus sp. PCC 7305]ELS01196.1 hypothetical protein Xen7305DRAFT_00008980 [Xenococcus sp. PCC 7305]